MHNRKTTATYLSIRFVLFFQSIFVLVFLIKEPTVLCFLSIHHNIAIFHSNNCRSNNSNKIRCRSYSKVLLSRTIATTATDRIVTSCQRSFSWQRQHQYYCNLYNHHRRRTNSFLSSASSSVSRFRRYSSIVDDNMSTASSTTTSNLRFVDIGAK